MAQTVTAAAMDAALFGLLQRYCGALIAAQAQNGGLLCPACGRAHGRSHEAVYPLMYMAQRTGEQKYLAAAKKLFAWSAPLLQPDGGMLNDFSASWKGVTVFAAVSLHDALYYHGALLSPAERAAWEARLAAMGEWIRANLYPGAKAYINYYAAAACALALLGNYFQNEAYTRAAVSLAEHCLMSESGGLVYGEASPQNAVTPKGCRGVDIGYNADETLPCLCRCAEALGDEAMLARAAALYKAQLAFMLPDGAWDDSFGTRSFKWTYWGSRTADGCQDALFALGRKNAVFAEAAYRNLRLLEKCTVGGLLAGGPGYARIGEKICLHHTFCRAKALAGALDAGVYAFCRAPLPADAPPPLAFYPQTDTYRLANGGFHADITGYDARYKTGGHVSGGALSLLWHETAGPLTAAGMARYSLFEPHNQQLPLRPEAHADPCVRVETPDGRYSQIFDFTAVLRGTAAPEGPGVRVKAALCDETGARPPENCAVELLYSLETAGMRITLRVPPAQAENVRLVLPVTKAGRIDVMRGALARVTENRYCLTPGLCFTEYVITPDAAGRAEILLGVKGG